MMTESEDSANRKNTFDSMDFINFLQQKTSNGSLAESEDSSNGKNALDSTDFMNFLQQKSMKSTDSLNGILGPGSNSLFKSKDSFVSFLSKNAGGDEKIWNGTANVNIPTAIAAPTNGPVSKDSKFMVQKSQDWLKFNTLGEYVDMPYSTNMFSSTGSAKQQAKPSLDIPTALSINAGVKATPTTQEKQVAAAGTTKKKKRKRAPRKKIIPLKKTYLEFTDDDVLMGRGGKSNHHKGNTKYRAEIERLQEDYKKTDDKDEKTSIAAQLVARVQSYGGNFLEKDEKGWYIIDDVVARRKVSQALREDKDPEKRKAKRQRFLAKRARLEEEARKKGIQNGD